MGKLRTLIISAAAVLCPILAVKGTSSAQYIQNAAVLCAGRPIVFALQDSAQTEDAPTEEVPDEPENTESSESARTPDTEPFTDSPYSEPLPQEDIPQENAPHEGEAAPQTAAGTLISRNITSAEDEEINSAGSSGRILREFYGSSAAPDYITLDGGAQVRNCTSLSNDELLCAAQTLPDISLSAESSAPQVLIVHTHTTECYEPTSSDSFDTNRPCRSRNSERNMVAVGEALAKELSARGISVLHDGTVHDYPAYSGAYDRSEETIRTALADYPEIKIIIDLHRDAIENADGTRIAPTVEINRQSAAQFMIITGCDDGRFGNMPNYIENFKLACLIQKKAQLLYPGLARPVLFDYRNYNQHISTGSLLIEIGSHANSLDEAEYTAQLLGEIIAAAAAELQP